MVEVETRRSVMERMHHLRDSASLVLVCLGIKVIWREFEEGPRSRLTPLLIGTRPIAVQIPSLQKSIVRGGWQDGVPQEK